MHFSRNDRRSGAHWLTALAARLLGRARVWSNAAANGCWTGTRVTKTTILLKIDTSARNQSVHIDIFHTSHDLYVRAAMNTEPNVAAQSEPVKGALVPAGKGTKIAFMSGAKEPYITSAEAVEFSVVVLGPRLSAWNKPQPLESPREPDFPEKGWVNSGWHRRNRPRHNCRGQ